MWNLTYPFYNQNNGSIVETIMRNQFHCQNSDASCKMDFKTSYLKLTPRRVICSHFGALLVTQGLSNHPMNDHLLSQKNDQKIFIDQK